MSAKASDNKAFRHLTFRVSVHNVGERGVSS